MNYLNSMLLCDAYKLSHRMMFPEGMEVCYSTWTPRTSRIKGINQVVAFGLQSFIKDLNQTFKKNFFTQHKEKVVADYARIIKYAFGETNPDTSHIEKLYNLGYLPLLIKAVPEGTRVPIGVPMLTIQNTLPEFFWLTNYIETLASCSLWQASTSATLAYQYRKILDKYALETVGNTDLVQFTGHDFSMRGMSSLQSAISSGMGHLLSFTGTDTIPAIQAAEYYYGANVEKELIGTSVPASEHAIESSYGDDMEYIRNLITKVHPNGIVSIVSDGYDFWDIFKTVLPVLKGEILSRTGHPSGLNKVVIRGDSGDPVKIICGDPNGETELQRKGSVEALWDLFGGVVNQKGYKELDSHIGFIYGDAITLERAEEICKQLQAKGFASNNTVLGIGSFTYQFNTRDTFGFALKSTLCVINGVEKQIFKNPKTDDGTKKSQKGKVYVYKENDQIKFSDGHDLNSVMENDLLQTVYKDGEFINQVTFSEIRDRLKNIS